AGLGLVVIPGGQCRHLRGARRRLCPLVRQSRARLLHLPSGFAAETAAALRLPRPGRRRHGPRGPRMRYVVLIGCFVLMGSAAGWAGQEVFGPVAMALAAVLGFATAALFAYRRQQADRSARPWQMLPVWGLMLAVGLYFA